MDKAKKIWDIHCTDSWSILKPLYPWKTKRGFMITQPLMILETGQG